MREFKSRMKRLRLILLLTLVYGVLGKFLATLQGPCVLFVFLLGLLTHRLHQEYCNGHDNTISNTLQRSANIVRCMCPHFVFWRGYLFSDISGFEKGGIMQ